jgi:lysophospholipase L1-like esterase
MRICFFGDSFVNGTGDDDCLGWVGRVCAFARQKGVDLTCYNLGIRRDTSADILRRWRTEAEARLPAEYDGRLVFSFGTNDCSDGASQEFSRVSIIDTLSNARSILSAAKGWKPALVMGPLPVSTSSSACDRIAMLSSKLENLCTELGIPFLDFLHVANSMTAHWERETRAGDGVHPNRGAYAQLAEAVNCWPPWQEWTRNP